MQIIKTFESVEPYLDQVRELADAHKKEFGFLPQSAYRDQALQGKLWVALSETDAFAGYLIFGGTKPSLKVFQMFVHSDHRGAGVGSLLIHELEAYGEKYCYLNIKARVAADLPANHFWDKNEFYIVGQVPGGKTTNRIINQRVKELKTPSLFDGLEQRICDRVKNIQSEGFGNHPVLSTPTYALDLNVFFDVLRKRATAAEASEVFHAGWSNLVKLCITPEFITELERTSKDIQKDPLLTLAKELPRLRRMSESDIDALVPDLHMLVFPQRSSRRKAMQNDKSDLRHLCYAIFHKLNGFVTREKAILNARQLLLDKYGLDIVSPGDFSSMEPDANSDSTYSIETTGNEKGVLDVCTCSCLSVNKVDKFLKGMNVESISADEVWKEELIKENQRHISANLNDDLVAIGSWSTPLSVSMSFNAFLFVQEERGSAVKIIDHFLEKLLRDVPEKGVYRISLIIGRSQTETLNTAQRRGFAVNKDVRSASVIKLVKYAVGGVIDQVRWTEFVHRMKTLEPTFEFPEKLPSHEVFCNTGILLRKDTHPVKLFDFENIFSPGISLPKGRDAIIVPIKQAYADQLIGRENKQLLLNFGPAKPALICMERAYFRAPRDVNSFKQGMIVIFYVSANREGGKELLGWARITSNQKIHVDDVKIHLSRQGVLSDNELSELTNKEGMLHAFTFDNFARFPNKLSYKELKEEGFIGGANLVTAQPLSNQKLEALCKLAYQNS